MNRLKLLVYVIVAICAVGTLFARGQVRGPFEQMFILLAAFILVVELVPQVIVGEEKHTEEAA